MNRSLFNSLSILVILLCALTARADLRIKQRSTSGGRTSESVIATKGVRQRYESDPGGGSKIVNISQCDLKRNLMVNDAAKRYMVMPTGMSGADAGAPQQMPPPRSGVPQPQPERRAGGVITYIEALTDTGERKQMFGLTARHIKTATRITSDANACTPLNQREETDGWYIDLDYNYGCMTGAVPGGGRPPAMPRAGCEDKVVRRQTGTAKLGYPVLVTRTTYGADGQVEFQSTTEVIELSRAALDPSLFEVPAGYTEAASYQEMFGIPTGNDDAAAASSAAAGAQSAVEATSAADAMAMAAAAKRPGMLRVGIVGVINRAERDVSTGPLQMQLVGAVSSANIDAVAITATAPAAIEAEAKQKGCDFILYTDVTNLKSSAAKKLGGMFGKATGLGSGGLDKTEARVEFRLMAIGNNATPQLQSSATGKAEGDDAGVAAALKKEAQMVVAEVAKK